MSQSVIPIQIARKICMVQVRDADARILVPCEIFGSCQIVVPVSALDELLTVPRRRVIQEILPDISADAREIFVTGMSPAEWDQRLSGSHKEASAYSPFYDHLPVSQEQSIVE